MSIHHFFTTRYHRMLLATRKTIIRYLLICLAVQGMAMPIYASPMIAMEADCHSIEPALALEENGSVHPHRNQNRDHPQNQPNCCYTDCDMESCFSALALIPTNYLLHYPSLPLMETAYRAPLPALQAASLFRPPITH